MSSFLPRDLDTTSLAGIGALGVAHLAQIELPSPNSTQSVGWIVLTLAGVLVIIKTALEVWGMLMRGSIPAVQVLGRIDSIEATLKRLDDSCVSRSQHEILDQESRKRAADNQERIEELKQDTHNQLVEIRGYIHNGMHDIRGLLQASELRVEEHRGHADGQREKIQSEMSEIKASISEIKGSNKINDQLATELRGQLSSILSRLPRSATRTGVPL
ncbi:MAG: hypothetical protein JO295_13605 [Verrucomicrobia bacterium]|nr:hypothetical protein [Verrucomicrobiota bacterium]